MFETDTFKSIYSCARDFQPAVVVEEIDDRGEVYETLNVEKKKTKASKYLPGERLLLKLNKQKKQKNMLDVNKITNSLQNVLQMF
jgi:hypothetical protein